MKYQNLGYRWLKAQRKYRKIQSRLQSTSDQSVIDRLLSKLDQIKRRILDMNRKWKLGVASSILLAWLAATPAQAQFTSPFELDSINGNNGFTINGINSNDRLGRSVQIAKDINGDGFDDLLITMNGYDNTATLGEGKAYIVFGSNAGFPSSFDLATLDGSNGFEVTGINTFPSNGSVISGLDDINGDGIGDFSIGASFAANSYGQTYVVFGKNTGFAASLDVSALDGSNGFTITGKNGDQAGVSVAQADVNGDGLTDLIIGAPYADVLPNTNAGKTYIVFGSSSPFGANLDLTTLNGTNGFTIYGNVTDATIGTMVSNVSDVNGDGIDDLLTDAGRVNESHIVFGTSLGFADSLNVAALDGSNGFTINGFPYAGFSSNAYTASGAGDINGDGLGDIIIGAYNSTSEANDTKGTSFIVFGSSSPYSPTFDITSINGTNGFIIESIKTRDRLGNPIGAAGDINGDGIDDVFIGNRSANTGYALFGKLASFGDTLSLSTINGKTGVDIKAYNLVQFSIGAGGDVNGDGVDDLILGNARDSGYTGKTYVIFGDDALDTTPPTIVTLKPVDNATNASRTNNLTISFNERIEKGVGNIIIYRASDDTIFETIDVGNANVEVSLKSMVINPTASLQESENYYVQIDNTAIRDVWGNDFAGINDKTTWNFKTVSANEFASTVEITSLDGTNGFTFGGVPLEGQIYGAVSNAGDFNGDGFDDILLSYPYSATDTSEVYLVFGKAGGFQPSVDLSALNGSDGMRIDHFSSINKIGYGPYGVGGVSAAGDINGDGFDDVIMSSKLDWNDTGNSYGGEVYVVFGNNGGATPFNVSSVNGTTGIKINGLQTSIKPPAVSDNFTFVVGGQFDINADGVDDVIIGAYESDITGMDNAGKAYVIFGSSSSFASAVDASSLDGSNGFTIDGLSANSRLGAVVSGAGDINGDGIEDIMVSAYNTSPDGVVYVIFGKNGGFGSSIDLSTLDGSNGFSVSWSQGAKFGRSLSQLGDVNGDGIDDIIIGATYGTALGVGSSYVVFGKNTGFSASVDVATLDGTNGFSMFGEVATDYSGFSVSGAGDVNGDGFNDMMVSAPVATIDGVANAGKAYVIFGKGSAFAASLDLASINGTNGFAVAGAKEGDTMGYKISSAGDMNNDGADDILVGSYYSTGSYVVFGVKSQAGIGGVSTQQHNALVDLYNATDGSNWTNNTNWNTTSQVSDWAGVGVSSNNVISISLPNNNIIGPVPASIADIATLQVFNIANNEIVSLPDLTSLGNLTTLDVTGNNLDFASLEINAGISGITYSDQQPTLADPIDTVVYVGQPYELTVDVSGASNTYQWFKDSVAIFGETNDTLTIAALNRASMGEFYAQVSNSSVPGLVISSNLNKVLAGADISGSVKDAIDNTVLDNGKVELFKVIPNSAFDSTATVDITTGGNFTISKAILGEYILLAKVDTTDFPGKLPSYWTSTIFWEEADTLTLDVNEPNIDILVNSTPPDDSGGEGSIFGSVFEDLPVNVGRLAARRKLPRASVSVRRKRGASRATEEVYDLIGYVSTNEEGDYKIDGLLPGTYRFNVQYPGIPMDTINSNIDIEITDKGANKSVQAIATVTEDGILLETTPLGIDNKEYKRWIEAYPVPSNNTLFVKLDQYRKVDVVVSINTVTGKTISSKIMSLSPDNLAPLELNISNLEVGVYILEIRSIQKVGNEPLSWRTRFIKSE